VPPSRAPPGEILDGATPLGLRLLDRAAPAELTPRPGETPRQVVLRVGPHVRDAVLAVQGPPGSGKTTVGADLIRALLDAKLNRRRDGAVPCRDRQPAA